MCQKHSSAAISAKPKHIQSYIWGNALIFNKRSVSFPLVPNDIAASKTSDRDQHFFELLCSVQYLHCKMSKLEGEWTVYGIDRNNGKFDVTELFKFDTVEGFWEIFKAIDDCKTFTGGIFAFFYGDGYPSKERNEYVFYRVSLGERSQEIYEKLIALFVGGSYLDFIKIEGFLGIYFNFNKAEFVMDIWYKYSTIGIHEENEDAIIEDMDKLFEENEISYNSIKYIGKPKF